MLKYAIIMIVNNSLVIWNNFNSIRINMVIHDVAYLINGRFLFYSE